PESAHERRERMYGVTSPNATQACAALKRRDGLCSGATNCLEVLTTPRSDADTHSMDTPAPIDPCPVDQQTIAAEHRDASTTNRVSLEGSVCLLKGQANSARDD